jgi:uncharacterized membrane protein
LIFGGVVLAPAAFWPTVLGVSVFVAGIFTYRRELSAATSRDGFGLVVLGPTFVAASLAAFAGEHFTAARSLAQLVPKFLPGRLFIAYLVGVAHLAAALSFVARRCIRWAALFLAIMFGLFVLLMDLPGSITHPSIRIFWVLAARETTFAVGALALFATAVRDRRPAASNNIASIARFWTAFVLILFGSQNVLFPQYSPGVPDTTPTAAWVPMPHAIAYLTGILLIAFGIAMLARKYAASAGTLAGALMTLLTVTLYLPNWFLARSVAERVTAINFIFDTLLFAGMLLVITRAILDSESLPAARSQTAI